MKILHIVRQFSPSIGGIQDFVYNLSLQQVRRGLNVTVYTLDTDFKSNRKYEKYNFESGFHIVRFSWYGSSRYPICFIPCELLNSFDIIHVHAVDFFVEYTSFLKRIGRLTPKLILTTHGGIFHTKKHILLKKLFFNTFTPLSLRFFDSVICCSVNDHNLFSSFDVNTVLIENGVSFSKFGKKLRRQRNNDFIYFGRFSENKKIPELIKLFSLMPNPDIKLKIIGKSNSGSVDLFKTLIGKHNLNVELHIDIDDTEILEHLSSAKFTVSASSYEGFGLSVIELMSYGLIPLLSKDPPSFRKFILDSGCGATFSREPELFNDIVNQLISSWSHEKVLLATNYSLKFSWNEVEILYSDVYQKVLYPNN